MLRILIAVFTVAFSMSTTKSQEVIFPGFEGEELLDMLRMEYTPDQTLPWNQARDTMFSRVDKFNDSVECIYTGHKLFLPDDVDPTEWLFMSGSPMGLNTEHVYPRSKGAFEFSIAYSDMHNLRASLTPVNTDRGDFPFGEIDDENTERWYRLLEERSSIPPNNLDEWSEWSQIPDNTFEPRDIRKGEIARTVLYFYAVYQGQADNADPDFFPIQVEDVCRWYYEDPVTEREVERSRKIADYQGNENPFVLDCTLAERTFCEDWAQKCWTDNEEVNKKDPLEWKIIMDASLALLEIEADRYMDAEVVIYNMSGIEVSRTESISVHAGIQRVQIPMHGSPSGVYVIRILWRDGINCGLKSKRVFLR